MYRNYFHAVGRLIIIVSNRTQWSYIKSECWSKIHFAARIGMVQFSIIIVSNRTQWSYIKSECWSKIDFAVCIGMVQFSAEIIG